MFEDQIMRNAFVKVCTALYSCLIIFVVFFYGSHFI